jgi:hypothetical protein
MIRQSAPLQVAMGACSCVGVSPVTIRLQFARSQSGKARYEEDWEAAGTIWIDVGKLEAVVRAAKSFESTAGMPGTD